ncbi:hypothetical protein KC332_g2936 [Hortaea werneckii]|uniref:Uncharacterized protein n=2 Tax=Hortaea werneckii TaxID=91943 RepID=A0A1Z5SMG1_HORWE|nr:hypothetical protein KC358_g10809 [Hortaea werneckii]OTA22022.1 hypothetical protein BTJ68_14631 [Hortaea werneckii EXF-2000]KAI6818620.1 hypothetical protein KC350_g10257 [Hortaea werneckii]KAI6941751.1 hypothetical protein KC341_g2674 [Hortaea werneckii]KAI6946646.1 hypothetical protein KC348_g3005 [Hortaea werneckii]
MKLMLQKKRRFGCVEREPQTADRSRVAREGGIWIGDRHVSERSIPHYTFNMQYNTVSAYIARNKTEQFLMDAGADPTAVITINTPSGKNGDMPTSPLRAEAPAFQVNSQSASECVPGLTPVKNVNSASDTNGKAKDSKKTIPGDDHAAAKIKTSVTPATSASVNQLKKLVGTQVAEEILGKWDPSNPDLKITMPVWTQPMYKGSDRAALHKVIEKMYEGRLYRKFDFGTKIMKIALKKGIEGRLPADRIKASDQPGKGTSPKQNATRVQQTTGRTQPTNSRALPTSRVRDLGTMNPAWSGFLISEHGRLESLNTHQMALASDEARWAETKAENERLWAECNARIKAQREADLINQPVHVETCKNDATVPETNKTEVANQSAEKPVNAVWPPKPNVLPPHLRVRASAPSSTVHDDKTKSSDITTAVTAAKSKASDSVPNCVFIKREVKKDVKSSSSNAKGQSPDSKRSCSPPHVRYALAQAAAAKAAKQEFVAAKLPFM